MRVVVDIPTLPGIDEKMVGISYDRYKRKKEKERERRNK